ncbi:uncharacterized protein TRIVIDRAFT_200313 [Trichoderma virens Gv29-8]|uniref:Uncharacterized protein n=1 Tax=Hypocrea virens (strain Gv29-8 / FGSC 10586) TaxID=413071 RepID=G9MQ45_HYPVG|nr:uncharacterized protein TRIVIDRAFT_200313 [Trichoderma virens Gv29-8]EHK23994.1 hypothetical protein TRIVIDRAFT_200313 [Trichoderma virens Gv29-8]UKZ50304.1 hypothetical protein TrVGV298_004561 [Trichoderma virens]
MSAVGTRRAQASQGGLARLVSKFENLGASKPPQDIGSAYEARDYPTLASKFPDAPLVQENPRDKAVGASRTVTSPSLAPMSASIATQDRLEPRLRSSHVVDTATPLSKTGKLISRRGLAVADMRRLFEQGLDETANSNVARTATYEPKRITSPTVTNECSHHITASHAKAPMKGPSVITEVDALVKPDLQEERDVPDLASIHRHVEHPEYLPRPLASPDRSSRHLLESQVGIEDSKSTWQRNEPRFKLQGGVFLHKTPSPLKNMVVTEIGTWHPKACDTSEAVSHPEGRSLRSDDQRRKADDLELLENLQPGVTLCYPCHDAVLSSMTYTDSYAKEPRGPPLPLSKSVPSQQSKVSNLRRKFDSALPSPQTPPRPIAARQGSERQAFTQDGSHLLRSGNFSAKDRRLKETIGLFESMSHQANREDRFGHIPKISSSPTFRRTAASKSKLAGDAPEQAVIKAWDGPPPPRLLSPVANGPPRSYNRSPGMDSISSQASDLKPLLYTKPSMIKRNRHGKNFGTLIRSDWRRKTKSSSEDDGQQIFPVRRQGYNVDGEGGADFEQKYQEISREETWTDDSEASSTIQKPSIADRHPSLRLLRRRLMSRSHGLFVSQVHCALEQPQPVRGKELRSLTTLCRERMAALRARAQTE